MLDGFSTVTEDERCPICTAPLSVERDVHDLGTLVGEIKTCDQGHYYYEFCEGHSRITIGDREWDWHDEKPTYEQRVDAIRVARGQ